MIALDKSEYDKIKKCSDEFNILEEFFKTDYRLNNIYLEIVKKRLGDRYYSASEIMILTIEELLDTIDDYERI